MSGHERAPARRGIEIALRQALPRHELSLHYQPRVDAQNGRIIGAEALLRWHANGHDLYQPDQFIPIAEDCGLILPIGAWVLRQAGEIVAAAWPRHPDFGERLAAAVPARRLLQLARRRAE